MTGGELGWTLEDNGPVNTGILTMGAKPYKRYRVFTKTIDKDLATPAVGVP